MKITEETATVYKLRSLTQGGWADITIREIQEGTYRGGSFDCQSDFGSFNHTWTSIGESTFIEFLLSLDKHYFMKKTRPEDYMLFSLDESCDAMCQDILRYRRDQDLTEVVAREAWETVERVRGRTPDDSQEYYRQVTEVTRIAHLVYCDDVHSIPCREIYNPMCDMFWERVWPHITKYWKANECSK